MEAKPFLSTLSFAFLLFGTCVFLVNSDEQISCDICISYEFSDPAASYNALLAYIGSFVGDTSCYADTYTNTFLQTCNISLCGRIEASFTMIGASGTNESVTYTTRYCFAALEGFISPGECKSYDEFPVEVQGYVTGEAEIFTFLGHAVDVSSVELCACEGDRCNSGTTFDAEIAAMKEEENSGSFTMYRIPLIIMAAWLSFKFAK